MARGSVVGYKTNSRNVPAVVEAQYDNSGAVVADQTGFTGVTTVDLLLLGVDAGRRTGVTFAAEGAATVNQAFQYNSA